jgi:hypothetical protein
MISRDFCWFGNGFDYVVTKVKSSSSWSFFLGLSSGSWMFLVVLSSWSRYELQVVFSFS